MSVKKAIEEFRVRRFDEITEENAQLKARISELEELIGGKRGEICESCGIDVDTVTERLMQAQERNNDLSLELMECRKQDIENTMRMLQSDQGDET